MEFPGDVKQFGSKFTESLEVEDRAWELLP